MNVLFIDDDGDTNFLIDLLVKALPYINEYRIIDRAEDALGYLKEYGGPLACIFVDIKMPEMNGFEFVQKFEEQLRDKFPSTRVYFVTSSARESDRSFALGFDSVEEVILKPLTRNKLKEIHANLPG